MNSSICMSSNVNLCLLHLFLYFYSLFNIWGRHLWGQLTQVVVFWWDSVPKRHTFHWWYFIHTYSLQSINTHRNKGKHWDVLTIDIQVHCTLRFLWHMSVKWFVFTSYILPLKEFLHMTRRSGPNPRELYGKIPTTSLSFEAGSEVHPYCFPYTYTICSSIEWQHTWQV